MPLPDLPRAGLLPPARALAASAADWTRRLTWRSLHPAAREQFVEAARPDRLVRVTYTTSDGCSAPLFKLPLLPGAPGEPVLLAHGFGLSGDAYRYGVGQTVAGSLAAAGFQVYLLTHRGDREAVGAGRTDFDAILGSDVPAAVAAAVRDSGFPLVHWVGHGLGGQLGLVAAARREALASVVALGAPVQFDGADTEWRRLTRFASLVPQRWGIPVDRLAKLAVPFLGADERLGEMAPARARGTLEYGTGSVAAGLLAQLSDWFRQGHLCSRGGLVDYRALFGDAEVPLLVGYATDSRTVPARDALDALHRWGHSDALALPVDGNSAALLSGGEDGATWTAISEWLTERRRLAWAGSTEARVVNR